MPWKTITPTSSGGGRRPKQPAARLYADGQLSFTHAAVELLGSPERVRVEYNTDAHEFRIFPAAPDDAGSWSLAGGGNSPHRVGLRAFAKANPEYVGIYTVRKSARGILLIKEE